MFTPFCQRKEGRGTAEEEYPEKLPMTITDIKKKSSVLRPIRGKVRTRSNKTENLEDSHSHHSYSESSADDDSTRSFVSVKAGISKCCVQGTVASRRWQIFQMMFLPFIPITALIVQNSTQLSTIVTTLSEAGETKLQIVMIQEIGKLLVELQQERAEFGFCLFTNSTRTTLASRFQRTDDMIRNLSEYVANYVPPVTLISKKRERVFQLTEFKASTDDTALEELLYYNMANDVILELLNQRIRKTKSTDIWRPLIAYMNLIRAIENYSISMVYGLYYFGKGSLSQRSYNRYIQYDSLASDYLNSTKSYSPEMNAIWEKFVGQWRSKGSESSFQSLEERRAIIYRNSETESIANDSAARTYYANMTEYINELRILQTQLKDYIEDQIMEEIRSAITRQAVAAFLLAIVLSISPILLFLTRKVTSTIQAYSVDLCSKTTELRREKRRSDKLLKQMLPAEVIRQLKKNRQVPAESFECVTIYFSDIVSFTKLSSTSSPMEIIVMLNSLYRLFDSKIELYDVYKVETIGDAYMVVSGLPLRNENRHAGEICTMALDLIAGVKQYRIPHRPGVPLQIRVGINSGSCVSGVVGTRMPRYCLFGDTINTASRMESHGEAMKIHITQTTKTILDNLGGYITESRGDLEIKGKGLMTTYWLVDKVGGLPKKEVELSTPGFFRSSNDDVPEFIHDIFGESEDGDEGLKITVGKINPVAQQALSENTSRNPKFPLPLRNFH